MKLVKFKTCGYHALCKNAQTKVHTNIRNNFLNLTMNDRLILDEFFLLAYYFYIPKYSLKTKAANFFVEIKIVFLKTPIHKAARIQFFIKRKSIFSRLQVNHNLNKEHFSKKVCSVLMFEILLIILLFLVSWIPCYSSALGKSTGDTEISIDSFKYCFNLTFYSLIFSIFAYLNIDRCTQLSPLSTLDLRHPKQVL